jgi:putative serine protease PepD
MEPQETHVNRHTRRRRTAPVAAALALGAGAGAGIYAGIDSGSHHSAATTTVGSSVPAQPAAATTTGPSLTQIYTDATPGVVDITVNTTTTVDNGFFGPQQQQGQAEGSGFVYDDSGHIITNAHVVDGATAIKVRFKDGTTAKATLVGKDVSSDLAVLKVDAPSSELHPLQLGDSSAIEPGDSVVAIGSPFGLAESMTAGIVRAIDRSISAPPPSQFTFAGAIQTDAAINHGNSGGPLIAVSDGKVIGVNAQIDSTSNDNAGVGFAIPSSLVKSVAGAIISGGKVEHAYLGVRIGDAPNAAGALIGKIESGSPADKAGLKSGDVVTAIDGKTVASSDDLTARVASYKPGDKVTFTVERNGSTKSVDVTFGQRP